MIENICHFHTVYLATPMAFFSKSSVAFVSIRFVFPNLVMISISKSKKKLHCEFLNAIFFLLVKLCIDCWMNYTINDFWWPFCPSWKYLYRHTHRDLFWIGKSSELALFKQTFRSLELGKSINFHSFEVRNHLSVPFWNTVWKLKKVSAIL